MTLRERCEKLMAVMIDALTSNEFRELEREDTRWVYRGVNNSKLVEFLAPKIVTALAAPEPSETDKEIALRLSLRIFNLCVKKSEMWPHFDDDECARLIAAEFAALRAELTAEQDELIREAIELCANILFNEETRHVTENGPHSFCESYGCSSLHDFAMRMLALTVESVRAAMRAKGKQT